MKAQRTGGGGEKKKYLADESKKMATHLMRQDGKKRGGDQTFRVDGGVGAASVKAQCFSVDGGRNGEEARLHTREGKGSGRTRSYDTLWREKRGGPLTDAAIHDKKRKIRAGEKKLQSTLKREGGE